MKLLRLLLLALCLFSRPVQAGDKEDAESAASKFLRNLETQDYGELYESAAGPR
jgi:hypothetical protein